MLKKLIVSLSIFSCVVASVAAQGINISKSLNTGNGYFDHLDVSASIGSPGIGIDVATPIGDYVKVRAGISYMPRFEVGSGFRVQVGDSLERKFDSHGNRIETKFDKLSGMLRSITGYDVDDEVEMRLKPSYYNFRFLVDVFPFRDKRWHFTAGFYAGNSELGRAVNSVEDMPSLMAVSMYNMMYDRLKEGKPMFDFGGNLPSLDLAPEIAEPLLERLDRYGRMGVHVGNYVKDGPILYRKDAEIYAYTDDGAPIYDWDSEGNPILEPIVLDENGNPKLEYYKGDPYMMVPGEKDGLVRVYAKSRRFKPYVGFGYGGTISKDGLTELSFDAGVLFWGGVPHVYTHDGTDLVNDVEHISGKVGRYVDIIKAFPVFPVLELRITRRIF